MKKDLLGRAVPLLFALVCATSCTSASELAGEPGPVFEEGEASHYADSLAGRKTASGEPYDPQALTCAHQTLEMGTVLAIEAVRTGAKARCRVNDRGPYAKDRILDVSRKVAEKLGMDGVAKVELRRVQTDSSD